YWLGKSMHSRPLGFFVAALAILRELNAFAASTMLDLSHARFLLTEYPVRVGLAAISLWLFLWFRKDPRVRMAYALPVGGALALLILLRFNALVMPFAVLAGIILVFGRDWKGWLASTLLVVLSMTIVLSPWMWRSWTLSGNPFFFTSKPQYVLKEGFRSRPPSTPTPAPPTSFKPISPARNISLQRVHSDSRQSSMPPAISLSNPERGGEKIAAPIINHFAHNLVASVLILPTDPIFHDLRRTIYETHPYWGKVGGAWQGNLTPVEALGLWINLALLSIGIGLSWKKWKLAGLVPLGIFLAYNLSAALARTSGGRYIVPMDWVVLFYFALGLMQIIFWGAALFGLDLEDERSLPEDRAFSWQKGAFALLPFFLFVGAMTIIDRTTPQRYPELTKDEVFDLLIRDDLLTQTGISRQELGVFLTDPDARAFFGLGLFPRYYAIDKGEHTAQRTAYSPESFPRLGFTFIGPFGAGQAVLPLLQSPSYFPHAEDVIVVGCITKPNPHAINVSLDALMVIVLGEDETAAYTRDPAAPLQCPLPEPICENNKNCR
ncbi:MAG: hypothetical protein GXP40_05980, partial [Chloroflexi bacterium]|nr:hypothetical protein [Chloroflexota bacterium]